MELIKSNNTISSATPKIIETPKHFSLNTQLYNKLSFKPYPMKFFTRSIGRFLSLYTSIDRSINTGFYSYPYQSRVDSIYNSEHNLVNIIQDKSDHDIFYAIRPMSATVDNTVVEKIKYDEVTMEYTVLNSIDIGSSLEKLRCQVKTFYENDDTLVLYAMGREVTNSTGSIKSGLFIIDKATFGVTTITSTDYNNFLLETSDDAIYFLRAVSSTTYSNYYINKLNINTKVNTQIFTYEHTAREYPNKRTMCNTVKIGNSFYMLFTHYEDNKYFYKMMKTSIDTNTDTVTTELLDIDLNKFVLDSSDALSYGASLYHTLRLIETDKGLYLSLLIHSNPNETSTTIFSVCKHALLKVEDDKFTVIDMIPLVDGCFGSLEYIDAKNQIFFTSNSLLFYSFNETEEKMFLTHKRAGIFCQVGLDSLNRIITHSREGSIEIITEGNSSSLQAKFNEEIYNKDQNSNVETTVDFYAKNFLDKYVDTEVKLTLIGPVMFKENDSQILVTSSSNEGIKSIPVVITGVGNIEVIITQNT